MMVLATDWHSKFNGSYPAVLDALAEGTLSDVTDASLGRLWSQIQEKSDSFAIILADSPKSTPQHIGCDYMAIRSEILKRGFAYMPLIAYWQERSPEKLVTVAEPSAFVPRLSYKTTWKLIDRFELNGAIYAGPETNGQVATFLRQERREVILGHFCPEVMVLGYSKLKGRTFTSEDFALVVSYSSFFDAIFTNSYRSGMFKESLAPAKFRQSSDK